MVWHCLHDPMFSGFDTIPDHDRQTDRQTQGHSIYHAIRARTVNLVGDNDFRASDSALWLTMRAL